MKHRIFTKSLFAAGVLSLYLGQAQQVADFENLQLSPNSYWNGAPSNNTPFESGDAIFENKCTTESWGIHWSSGFAYSNKSDVTTEGLTNMYSAISGKGANNSSNYVVAQDGATIRFKPSNDGEPITGLYITNSTYAALSMAKGDTYAKKFGGDTGNDPDYFYVTIRGYDQGAELPQPVRFYLADFRATDNTKDYIVKTWKWVDLSNFGSVDSLKFELSSSDVDKQWGWMNTPAFFCIDNLNLPYFADAVGTPTTDAISSDSSIIKSWATSVQVTRGYQDISKPELGLATVGTEASAIGKVDASVLSLGDGGTAIIGFDKYISNGQGPDFAVFENSFSDTYLELATVEVSSDGINFYPFPAISNTQDTIQVGGFGALETKYLSNIAGKYKAKFGTPFDLELLKDIPNLDINKISYIKLKDVVGNIGAYATLDINGNPINDPWSTPYASSGFDLDAVAVINEGDVISSLNDALASNELAIYPNPAQDIVTIRNSEGTVEIISSTGVVMQTLEANNGLTIDVSSYQAGVYLVKAQGKVYKLVKE